MKNILYAGMFSLLFMALGSCSGDSSSSSDSSEGEVVLDSESYESKTPATSSVTIEFTATKEWTAQSSDTKSLSLSETSGKAGKISLTCNLLTLNNTNADKEYTVTITSGSAKKRIKVVQPCSFILDDVTYQVDADATTLNVSAKVGVPSDLDIYIYGDSTFFAMYDDSSSSKSVSQAAGVVRISLKASSRATSDEKTTTFKFPIKKNEDSYTRTGYMQLAAFADGNPDNESDSNVMRSEIMSVSQSPGNVDSSDDFSKDGKYEQIQTHTKGNGIKLVLMGEAFTSSLIDDGTYDKAMADASAYFFTVEPFKSMKEYFDVYKVYTVSTNNVIGSGYKTCFSCSFGSGTAIEGDDDKAIKYATKAVGQNSVNDATIIVVLNDTRYAGTCDLYFSQEESKVPSGYSVAYVPMTDSSRNYGVGFEQVIHHEAGGHGFGKLADEYAYEENGELSSADKLELEKFQKYGGYLNVSTSSDVTKSSWADLAASSLYAYEALGCYEGGYTFYYGVWRPTKTSIMNDNTGVFNSPCRYLIYRRALKIASGTIPSFEDFVKFDESVRTELSAQSGNTRAVSRSHSFLPPLAKPKVYIKY